ncbi:AAA family ATPase [Paenibacillus sp. GCM10012306]|uniref:AAA family ATPase n=1 Tax=Paenibacillus sp. GCM10012306 TaxID=3317342 RepID=UPI0036082759
MKISIENFKGIKSLESFELSPITIISGVNSGGKSSLIQLMLMIKQTLENNYSEQLLSLNKPYVSLGRYKDIIYEGKIKNNPLMWELIFSKKDIPPFLSRTPFFRKLDQNSVESLTVRVRFASSAINNPVFVKEFYVGWKLSKKPLIYLKLDKDYGNIYRVASNSRLFFKDSYNEFIRERRITKLTSDLGEWKARIEFDKFFPFESISTTLDKDAAYAEEYFSPLALQLINRILATYFERISYLGPLRDEPHPFYVNDDDTSKKIGNKGEFAAHILERNSKNKVINYRMRMKKDGVIEYYDVEETLQDAVNYWICDVFKMANYIKANPIQSGLMYQIEIQDVSGIKVPINHVGFGISQILPIVIEGLLSSKKYTLIFEQPEIHLHPNVQSMLFDFLYSLTLRGKNVIVETHSDHLITRLRRRIAEDTKDEYLTKIKLTFVIKEGYTVLELTDKGSLTYWPEDFFNQLDQDIRAIVRAQAKKKTLNKSETSEEIR